MAERQRRIQARRSVCRRGERRDRQLRRSRPQRGVVGGFSPRERGQRQGALSQGEASALRHRLELLCMSINFSFSAFGLGYLNPRIREPLAEDSRVARDARLRPRHTHGGLVCCF